MEADLLAGWQIRELPLQEIDINDIHVAPQCGTPYTIVSARTSFHNDGQRCERDTGPMTMVVNNASITVIFRGLILMQDSSDALVWTYSSWEKRRSDF